NSAPPTHLCLVEKLFSVLSRTDIEFFAKPKRNLKNRLIRLHDQLLSRKLSIVETIIDQLKKISGFEHSRHRSPVNFCVNLLCGLIAYCHQPKKPTLKLAIFPLYFQNNGGMIARFF
ncbi:MAG: transposase, partial [Microcystis panniformis]